MKTTLLCQAACAVLIVAGNASVVAAEQQAGIAEAPLSREKAVLVTVAASIEAVDYTNREVVLKGPLGNKVTFTVDKSVERFGEFKVGDFVRADYYVSVAAELREPTAQEKETPFVMLDETAKAPPGTSPAAGGLRRFKVVATIEGLDRPTQTVTVKGPRGNYLTARVQDPTRLTQVRIGDPVIITYTEALAVSLEKAEKKTSE